MYLTSIMSQHLASVPKTLPPATRDIALRLILDHLGAAVAGFASQGARAARRSTSALFGQGHASVWFSGSSSTALGAVFCNSTASSALDVDDGHRAARGHPGAAVVPVALALAELHDCDADGLIAAIVAGYDIGVRVAAAQNPLGIATRQSGRWAGLASVATAAALCGHSAPVIAQALSIAAVLAPNQQANGSSGYSAMTGNDVKEGIAWSSVTGLLALELASHGHTGPQDLFDHPTFYDSDRITAGLGSRWEITGLYFKPYACCRYIHPALDRLDELIKRHMINPADILSIEVETFGWAEKLANSMTPKTLIDVQYSLPYCLALAVIDGADALLPPRETCLGRPELSEMAGRVRLVVNKDIDALFPAETLARVTVETKDKRFTSQMAGPYGDPRQPMLWHAIEGKFHTLTAAHLSAGDKQQLVDAVLSLASGDLHPLISAMRTIVTLSGKSQASSLPRNSAGI